MYKIKLEQFEGPLDLLLQLIEQRELDITHLSLAQVTDQYLAYIEEDTTITLEHLSDFLVVASRLILIKSKALLPILEFTDEEEEEIEDLEYRLKEYKRFKEAAEKMRELYASEACSFSREAFVGLENVFEEEKKMPKLLPEQLCTALRKVLDDIPDPEKLKEQIIRRTISLEEKIGQIKTFIVERAQFSFSEVMASGRDRTEIVVAFLAILELVRRRSVDVEQKEPFGDIEFQVNDR